MFLLKFHNIQPHLHYSMFLYFLIHEMHLHQLHICQIDKEAYNISTKFDINLNATGSYDYNKLIREMETYPHYLIVVKDFALPTIFDGVETNSGNPGIKSVFTSLSGDGSLSSPMCITSGKETTSVVNTLSL